jgi:hypothetical protein
MARYRFPKELNGITKDQNGRVLEGVTVSVFLAGTTTPAKIYATAVSTPAVYSVLSDASGSFVFYVSDGDYTYPQAFDIVYSKSSGGVEYTTTTSSNVGILTAPSASGNIVYNNTTAIAGNFASFSGGTGKLIEDSGTALAGFVTLTAVQTLTNKTLTSPKINEAVALTATSTQLNASAAATHAAVTVSAPIVVTGQALSIVNSAAATVTAVDTGTLASSDTVIPTSKAVVTAIAAASGAVVASGAELDTGTDNAKFASAKALKDSHNVPSVVPGTASNVLQSDGTDWISGAAPAGVVATGAELDTGTNNTKFASAKALKDSHNVPSVAPSTAGNVLTSDGTDWTSGVAPGWKQTVGTFTATPASTSTLTMTSDLTATILANMPLKYVIGGVTKYGMVGTIVSNLLTVNGAALSGDVTALYYGGGTIRQVVIIIPSTYEDATNTALITSDLKSSVIWALPLSYCVHFKIYSDTVDSSTKGTASVRINGTELCTTAGGLTLTAAKTWYATVVDIATAAYDINPSEAIEITAVKNGAGDASDLTVEMIFVTP